MGIGGTKPYCHSNNSKDVKSGLERYFSMTQISATRSQQAEQQAQATESAVCL